MSKPLYTQLSRRESQIMEIIYRLREASVSDVVRMMPDNPAYNSVRVTLSILEKKGYVTHKKTDRDTCAFLYHFPLFAW